MAEYHTSSRPAIHSLQVIAVCKSADLLLMVLDATKPWTHKEILTRELEAVGMRLNRCARARVIPTQHPPSVITTTTGTHHARVAGVIVGADIPHHGADHTGERGAGRHQHSR